MSDYLFSEDLNLQLFGEGGDGGMGSDGANGVSVGDPSLQTKGVKDSAPEIRYGIQDEAQIANVQKADEIVDRHAEFEKLIKGDFKDEYNARVQDTIQKRLKSTKDTVDRYNALTPTLDILSKKYGVDASDIEALNRAIEEDDSYFEDEALEKGITVEQLKSIRKMERENAELKQQMDQQRRKENADKIYAGWMDQAQELKSVYPNFNLEAELANPTFVNLLGNNIDVKTAFEVLHKDEIIPAAMQYTAKQVEAKLANSIRANNARPIENGISSQSSVQVKSDVTQLTKADLKEIQERVRRGERITFG